MLAHHENLFVLLGVIHLLLNQFIQFNERSELFLSYGWMPVIAVCTVGVFGWVLHQPEMELPTWYYMLAYCIFWALTWVIFDYLCEYNYLYGSKAMYRNLYLSNQSFFKRFKTFFSFEAILISKRLLMNSTKKNIQFKFQPQTRTFYLN